ncbi:MAG: DNA mismatch repair endonuclease MutL [Pyrinomonadaceae bacterium]|nr:DNA mismatch repair endonuclease MutL [Pyrinomonadaceae bacterium]
MNKIKVLSDNLANQIAAGEVVERPASVIKELIENSVDAGAKRIQIDIELGGRRLMRVTDDGEGMVRDDAILAFERHATSKIKTLEDLSAILTLGFRGEALASIASVAKVELITKTVEEDSGTRVLIEGGKLQDVKDAARSGGTTISVRDLFFNTPARRKFMRSEATENYHLTNIVTHYALAHHETAFTLTNNGREVLRVSPAKDLRERAYQIFGANLIESLLPVGGGRDYVANISGFVSAPRERRTTRDGQYFFVNRRFVRDKIIAGGLLEGFRSVLPHGVYPVAFLFLDIPPDEIDVNVHPAKTEIRFRRSEAVKDVIAEAIRGSLAKAGILGEKEKIGQTESEQPETTASADDIISNSQITDFKFQNGGLPTNAERQAAKYEQTQIEFQISADEFQNPSLTEKAATNETFANQSGQIITVQDNFQTPVFSNNDEQKAESLEQNNALPEDNGEITGRNSDSEINGLQSPKNENQFNKAIEMPPVDSAERFVKTVKVEAVSASKIRSIGQLHESFIIATDDEGLLLIDQHVAHERILFDKYRKQETERKPESQNLLLPETIDLTPAQAAAFSLVEEELESLGFGLMRLSGRTIAIKAVPTDLPAAEVRNLLAEILDTIDAEKRGGAKMTLRDQIAASLACKAAVKINMKLTPEKMQWLIDRLLFTSSPTTCPHGRPIILRLTMRDIERGFHRSSK